MNETIISLINEEHIINDDGDEESVKTEKEIFAQVGSVSQSEFMKAGTLDFRPEYKFVVWFFEYGNEKILKYDGEYYSIYRTFKNGDKIELYVTKRIGDYNE